ncbi:MAG: L-rhamnonate dehydratase [Acidimicrobiaceae bacterium]|nr:L-rhamnonate dehydratase [Acidimicrobiaceae bacterium]MYH77998.1 L-rhamnonate dehydratase [Acidimicrobiaceae bacterium]MYK76798.1 L-rhamnonate dehydratase [Acidimicrobiaceae bacterium]
MKIARVKVTHIDMSFWGEFAARQDELRLVTLMAIYPQYRHPLSSWFPADAMCVVEIQTDDGLVGTGWCEDYARATSAIIENHLTKILVGANPLERSRLWDQMFRSTMPYGRKGPALYAISALDIALWDLAGKHFGQPVFELLGGRARDPVPVYASHLHFTNTDEFTAEAAEYVNRGFKAMKMRFLHGPADGPAGLHRNVELVRLLRETVGDDIDIMADAYMGWDLEYALRMCRALAPFDMKWVEEPLLPDQLREYAILRSESPVPIAAGEHETTRYGFTQIIEARALDIIQFDIGRVGGFSEARKVCALAQAAGLPVYTHAYGMPTLHLATSDRAVSMVEYFPVPVWDDIEETTHFDGTAIPEGGQVSISDAPGLGATLSLDGFTPLV